MQKSSERERIQKTTFNLLKYTYSIVPIISGIDKFTNLLTQWEKYIPQFILPVIPFSTHFFMIIVGLIEIVCGFILLLKPVTGGWIGAVLLTVISISIFASGQNFDEAVRILVMAVGAYYIARNAKFFESVKA